MRGAKAKRLRSENWPNPGRKHGGARKQLIRRQARLEADTQRAARIELDALAERIRKAMVRRAK